MPQKKELMFCLSNFLPETEALSFARSIKMPDKLYLYKVSENPKAKHIKDRESYVVLRPIREGEVVQGSYGMFVEKGGLRLVG
jgi:hypothetical protein